MKVALVTPSQAFNLLQEDPRLLVLDTRPKSAFHKGHIRRAVCVGLAAGGGALQELCGVGPPYWSRNCWWDLNVLVLLPAPLELGRCVVLLGHPELSSGDGLRRVEALTWSEVDEAGEPFQAFRSAYPSLVTTHTKGASIPRYPAEVVPEFLYLGDWQHAAAEERLRDLGITKILTIHTEQLALKGSFEKLHCDLSDEHDADIAAHFEPAFQFIERSQREGGRVLVHCGAGASRSATLCAAYLMKSRDWMADEAIEFLKKVRSKVMPNLGFLCSLQKLQEQLRPAIAGGDQDHLGVADGGSLSPRENVSRSQQPDGRQPVREGHTTSRVLPSSSSDADLHLDVLKEGKCIEALPLRGKSTFVFGRLPTCDIILRHASISRQHAKLEVRKSHDVRLVDLGSACGTFVGDRQLRKGEVVPISEKIFFHFGASTRRYVVKGFSSFAGEADL
eukprot:SM000006S19385  [mRNA]  locus=s6:470661:473365:- [translate_table: standard]